jgi:teichuronic acid biosynthesis glycosyltransferase TuaC
MSGLSFEPSSTRGVEAIPVRADRQEEPNLKVLLLTSMYPTPHRPALGAAVARQRESLVHLGVQMDLFDPRSTDGGWLSTQASLRRLVTGNHYDLVHAHYGLRATVMALLQPLPVVVTCHGTDINGTSLTNWRGAPKSLAITAAAIATRQLARGARVVIVMTEQMRARLPPGVRLKTAVLPMGVDMSLFKQQPREQARKVLGWGANPVVLFCSANGDPVKRPDLARQSIEEAKRYFPDLSLFYLQGIAPADIPRFLSAADCLLVTSDYEGSPNIVRESLACNLPVVSVPVGDVPELLSQDPEAGRIVHRIPESIGRAIAEVLSQPRPLCLRSLVEPNSLQATAERIRELYKRVLQPCGTIVPQENLR